KWVRGYALSGESVVVVVGNYEFCRWINEESCPLGMRQSTSHPPSKPGHPRKLRAKLHRQTVTSVGTPTCRHKAHGFPGTDTVHAPGFTRRGSALACAPCPARTIPSA